MIVFRPREEQADAQQLVEHLLERVRTAPPVTHDVIAEWLIDAGVLESALVDGASPDGDRVSPILLPAARPTMLAGEALVASWKDEPVHRIAKRLERALVMLLREPLPERVTTRAPEGFLFHGLYPETYIAAAERFVREKKPAHVVCLGVRSIGTSLSAVVASVLARNRCRVLRHLVRPRGPVPEKRIRLDADLSEAFAERRRAWFLVVDEGPGLSGESMLSVADMLASLGIAEDRIVLFPSWGPDEGSFASARVRARWGRHRAYTGSFEDQWIASGRLSRALGLDALATAPENAWNPILFRDGRARPVPASGRDPRKLVGTRNGEPVLASFIGLGHCGKVKLERAQRLAEAGFAPDVLACANGFLATRLVAGDPARAPAPRELAETIARYLAFIRREFPVGRGTPAYQITGMARENIAEGLGAEWAAKLHGLALVETASFTPVRLDGGMNPGDWVRTPEGWRKIDATHHHEDHYFPGCSDIAWDVAAACEELGMDAAGQSELVARVRRLSGDKDLGRRMEPFRIAYLAYRLGYAELASRAVAPSAAVAWELVAADYRLRLKAAIERGR